MEITLTIHRYRENLKSLTDEFWQLVAWHWQGVLHPTASLFWRHHSVRLQNAWYSPPRRKCLEEAMFAPRMCYPLFTTSLVLGKCGIWGRTSSREVASFVTPPTWVTAIDPSLHETRCAGMEMGVPKAHSSQKNMAYCEINLKPWLISPAGSAILSYAIQAWVKPPRQAQ